MTAARLVTTKAHRPRKESSSIEPLTQPEATSFDVTSQAEKLKGRPSGKRNRSVTLLVAGENGLPDRMTLSRWRVTCYAV